MLTAPLPQYSRPDAEHSSDPMPPMLLSDLPFSSPFPPRPTSRTDLPHSRDRTGFVKSPGQGQGRLPTGKERRVHEGGRARANSATGGPKSGTGGHPQSYGRSLNVVGEVTFPSKGVRGRSYRRSPRSRGRIVPNAESSRRRWSSSHSTVAPPWSSGECRGGCVYGLREVG